jgi:hypothetical protein
MAPIHAAADASCISRSRAPTSWTQNWQCSFYQSAALTVEAERADQQIGSSEVLPFCARICFWITLAEVLVGLWPDWF